MNNNVSKINYLAVIAAVVAAAVVSSVWYSPFLFGKQWTELRDVNPATIADVKVPVWKIFVELVRELVVAYVLARFVTRMWITDWIGAVHLGFWVWLGFLFTTSSIEVIWMGKSYKLWWFDLASLLVSCLAMGAIIGAW